MVEVLRHGYRLPFHLPPHLASQPISLPSYTPTSIRGIELKKELTSLLQKGAVELAPLTPGFYSRLFVTQQPSGKWRPIIDLSALNRVVVLSRFHMETPQSVLRSVRQGDWMVSFDLKDAYLQVPVHVDSRKYLRFVSYGDVYQFKVLPFGLSTAPQVFTRVMAPVADVMHRHGFRLLRYLDDWLILASSKEEALRARDFLLNLCVTLGIRINFEKSHLDPSQTSTYLGMVIETVTFQAFPTSERLAKLESLVTAFLSCRDQPVAAWQSLLGVMSSLSLLVPNSRLRMRALQLRLNACWDHVLEGVVVSWTDDCLPDLLWWSDGSHLRGGLSLEVPIPDLHLYTDASDSGWGATLGGLMVSGLWSPPVSSYSINHRELLAIELALIEFLPLLRGRVVALFCDNVTAISYLKKSGGTRSVALNDCGQRILRWCECHSVSLLPQFVAGTLNVLADALSRRGQILGAEWVLHQTVVHDLLRQWPAMVDLFATSLNHRLPLYFSPVQDPAAVGVDALLQSWDNLQGYAFPPFALIQRVLLKVRTSLHCQVTLVAPFWPRQAWFPDLLDLLVDLPITLPLRRDLLRQSHNQHLHSNLHMLRLTAWRISSVRRGIPVSLQEWLNNLPSVAAVPRG